MGNNIVLTDEQKKMLNIIDKLEEYKKVLEEAKGYDKTIEKILFEEMGELIQAVSKMERILWTRRGRFPLSCLPWGI